MDEATALNTVVAFPALFVVYDFFYSLWHRFLHLRQFYKYIHKHHHHQHAPTRGNIDAVNVHPIEFIVGEYLHLAAIAIVRCHAITAAIFVVLGGILASLNHTRFDISAGFLFDVSPLSHTTHDPNEQAVRKRAGCQKARTRHRRTPHGPGRTQPDQPLCVLP